MNENMKVKETANHVDSGHSNIPAVSDHHLFYLSIRPDFKSTFQVLFFVNKNHLKNRQMTSVLS